jgi:hypothetical protein
MPNITIEVQEILDEPLDCNIQIFSDGTLLVQGYIGGEPEDNNVYRTYDWIIPAFQKLAESLGAQVEVIEP